MTTKEERQEHDDEYVYACLYALVGFAVIGFFSLILIIIMLVKL